jgi:hypothetical protein
VRLPLRQFGGFRISFSVTTNEPCQHKRRALHFLRNAPRQCLIGFTCKSLTARESGLEGTTIGIAIAKRWRDRGSRFATAKLTLPTILPPVAQRFVKHGADLLTPEP